MTHPTRRFEPFRLSRCRSGRGPVRPSERPELLRDYRLSVIVGVGRAAEESTPSAARAAWPRTRQPGAAVPMRGVAAIAMPKLWFRERAYREVLRRLRKARWGGRCFGSASPVEPRLKWRRADEIAEHRGQLAAFGCIRARRGRSRGSGLDHGLISPLRRQNGRGLWRVCRALYG